MLALIKKTILEVFFWMAVGVFSVVSCSSGEQQQQQEDLEVDQQEEAAETEDGTDEDAGNEVVNQDITDGEPVEGVESLENSTANISDDGTLSVTDVGGDVGDLGNTDDGLGGVGGLDGDSGLVGMSGLEQQEQQEQLMPSGLEDTSSDQNLALVGNSEGESNLDGGSLLDQGSSQQQQEQEAPESNLGLVDTASTSPSTLDSSSIETPATTSGESFSYTIVRGDWLSKIAKRVYQDMHKWPVIASANPQIANPDLIYPGDSIKIPIVDDASRSFSQSYQSAQTKIEPTATIAKVEVKVKKGDTLASIARKLGSSHWKELWNQNKDQIKNPNMIFEGQTLVFAKAEVFAAH